MAPPVIRAKITPSAISPRKKPIVPRIPPQVPRNLSNAMLPPTSTVPRVRAKQVEVKVEDWERAGDGGIGGLERGLRGLGISEMAGSSSSRFLERAEDVEMERVVHEGKEENVKVTVRIRPPASKLATDNAAIGAIDDHAWDSHPALGRIGLRGNPATSFVFDAVVESSDNEDVYGKAGQSLVLAAMEGFDAVVFAYGQTASGKTFTLSGTPQNPGIIPLSVTEIFEYIRLHPERDFLLRASYLEIYNETLRDLLDPTAAPKIRQDAQRRFFVSPLREECVTGEAQVEALLRRGNENRSQGSTDWNATSSRSHSVFQITIESRDESSSPTLSTSTSASQPLPNEPFMKGSRVRMSKLSLIDLAGSEQATSQIERRAEGAFINKSLLTLEKVIKGLTEMGDGKKPQHVPYRDSKLTQILQPSLSGAARVSVIATLNPSSLAIEETKSTLKFAQRIKKVVLRAVVKEVVDDKALINKYRDHIAKLEQELEMAMAQTAVPATPSRKQRDSVVNGIESQIEDLRAMFVNSGNLGDRRSSLLPPRPISPVKLSPMSASDETYEDKYFDLLESVQSLEKDKEELERRLAALENDDNDRVAMLMRENNELLVVARNAEPGADVRKLERQLEKCRVYEEGLEKALAAERNRVALFEKFILQHLQHQTAIITGRRRSSIGFTPDLPGLMSEQPDLGIISPDFVDLDDLEFSEQAKAEVEIVRSSSRLFVPSA